MMQHGQIDMTFFSEPTTPKTLRHTPGRDVEDFDKMASRFFFPPFLL